MKLGSDNSNFPAGTGLPAGANIYSDVKCPGGKTPVACMCNIDTRTNKYVVVQANPIQFTDTCRCYYSNVGTTTATVYGVAVQAVCPIAPL